MGIATRIKSLAKTYLYHKADVPEKVVLETEVKEIMVSGPLGVDNPNASVQPDGNLIITEIASPDNEVTDENIIRRKDGDKRADYLQDQATEALERISLLDMEFRDLSERMAERREQQESLMMKTPDFHFSGQVMILNGLAFIIVALGEIGALFTFFADFFGLDPGKISSETLKHPISISSSTLFSVSFFVATLLIAEKALYGTRKALWLLCLASISITIARARANQAAALQDAEMDTLFLFALYIIVGIALPLAAAVFARHWREAWENRGLTNSLMRRFEEIDGRYAARLATIGRERRLEQDRYAGIQNIFTAAYQAHQNQIAKIREDWEIHRRKVEAHLANIRLAYRFWQGWRSRGLSIPRPVKRFAQIAAVIFFALVFALLIMSSDTAHADDSFNLLALCDRSSSASDYSCTAKTIEAAGRFWLTKADDAGGGTFELLLIDKGVDSTILLFSESYPVRFPGPVSAHKKKWKADFFQRLATVTKSLPTNKGSAIIEALYRNSLRIPGKGKTLIYVMSDMREVNETFNFEKKVPPEKDFLKWIDSKAMRPRFSPSTELLACGLHPYTPDNTSRMTARNYEELTKLWNTVFAKWGLKASLTEACGLRIHEQED